MSKPIRIGILGASQVAPYALIAPASKNNQCVVQAVACRNQARGQAFADEHNIPHLETDYLTLVERDDIDLVYNSLPPSRHADISIAALNAGKLVLCEKPFAMNANEAARMVEASKATNVPLIEAFHYRFHPAFEYFMDLIRTNVIGDILRVQAVFVAPVPYQVDEVRHTFSIGGGSLMDMGCYPIHWARQVFASRPQVESASCEVTHPNIDVTTRAKLVFGEGKTAEIECSMDADRPFEAHLSVLGSNGRIKFDNPLSPHNGHRISVTISQETRSKTIDADSTYSLQLAHTLGVLKGNRTAITGGKDAVENMQIIDEIYLAAGLTPRHAD